MALALTRYAAAASAILAAPVLSAAGGATRTPVPGGQGCGAIQDRAACCLFVDGRADGEFSGQGCVPSREGVVFATDSLGRETLCQPSCWALGTCGEVHGHADQIANTGACPAHAAAALAEVLSSGKRQAVPGGLGCDSVADRTACCFFTDGRAEYAGQDCVPARANTFFLREDVLCEASCKATGSCGGPDMVAHAGFCAAPPVSTLPALAVLTQAVARVPAGGELRFYVVGSSNAAWQHWVDQLHVTLLRLGYTLNLPNTAIPGETNGPIGRRTPKCEDADTYELLSTPRVGLQGWSTWGFAYESEEECDAEGFRTIAGWSVRCANGWGCNGRTRVPLVPPSAIAKGVRGAHVVVLSNWVNDGKAALYVPHECYGSGDVPEPLNTTAISAENLRRTIRAIHAEDPDVLVLVLARYADEKQVLFVNNRTLDLTDALNAGLKEALKSEPNTRFVDLTFPQDVAIFQTLNGGHANCRGDKLMANAVVEAMYTHGVIANGLDLGDVDTCLDRADCESLDRACCQRSALCYVNPEGVCAPYGPGVQ